MSKIRKKLLKGRQVSVTQLLSLLPDEELGQIAEELEVDKWVKKLKAGALFKLVLFSILDSERLSLRVMENNVQDPLLRGMTPELVRETITWTGIRDRLRKVKVSFCQKLYERVYQKVQEAYSSEELAGYHLKRYDSTMIATFAHLLEGMKVGNTQNGKRQVKLTCEMSGEFLLQMHFHSEQAYLGEDIALSQAIQQAQHKSNDLVVFDKGLKKRQFFSHMDEQGILFVGRLHSDLRYDLLHPHWQDDGSAQDNPELEFIQDSAVYLYESGRKQVQRKLRLIQYRVKGEDQILSFVTNVWDVPAYLIAQVYRRRWDIEVLFRFMKQEMNLSHFVCNDHNAIQVMLYFTMIAAMLVLLFKQLNNIASYKMAKIQFFKELIYSIILDHLEDPEGADRLKLSLKKLLQKE